MFFSFEGVKNPFVFTLKQQFSVAFLRLRLYYGNYAIIREYRRDRNPRLRA